MSADLDIADIHEILADNHRLPFWVIEKLFACLISTRGWTRAEWPMAIRQALHAEDWLSDDHAHITGDLARVVAIERVREAQRALEEVASLSADSARLHPVDGWGRNWARDHWEKMTKIAERDLAVARRDLQRLEDWSR